MGRFWHRDAKKPQRCEYGICDSETDSLQRYSSKHHTAELQIAHMCLLAASAFNIYRLVRLHSTLISMSLCLTHILARLEQAMDVTPHCASSSGTQHLLQQNIFWRCWWMKTGQSHADFLTFFPRYYGDRQACYRDCAPPCKALRKHQLPAGIRDSQTALARIPPWSSSLHARLAKHMTTRSSAKVCPTLCWMVPLIPLLKSHHPRGRGCQRRPHAA